MQINCQTVSLKIKEIMHSNSANMQNIAFLYSDPSRLWEAYYLNSHTEETPFK